MCREEAAGVFGFAHDFILGVLRKAAEGLLSAPKSHLLPAG